jgi:nicotinate-nucleotide--dimethylbenzimidazole phosphoribosyltransferase
VNVLVELGADVEWPDSEASEQVGAILRQDDRLGSLRSVVEWAAAAQGSCPPKPFTRVRVLRLYEGEAPHVAPAAASDADPRDVDCPPAASAEATAEGIRAGARLADDEVECGADLLVLAARGDLTAAAVLVSVLTDTEPVKVLPRGADIPPNRWMADAITVRDRRRQLFPMRDDPFDLLAGLGGGAIATATGVLMRAAARRTPVLVDGLTATVAALACFEVQPRSARWWRLADLSDHPAHELAATRLGQRAVLPLGTSVDDGTAGLLAAATVRAATLAFQEWGGSAAIVGPSPVESEESS